MHLSSKTNIIILLYISLLLGFYFGEDSLGGAFNDYQSHNHISDKFNINFFDTLLNYDKLGHRHSPIFYIIKSLLIEDDTIRRLIFLHFYILIPIFFYKSLKIVFKNSSKTNLRLVASTLLLFPTVRSYSIWPDPHLLGTIFFIISVYYFLKFKYSKENNFKYSIINTFFLAIAAYCSPNFGIIVFFYLFEYLKKYNIGKKIIIILASNLVLSLPFFYYLFYLDINFIFNDTGWDIGNNLFTINNLANKFVIVNSLFCFYLIPLFFTNFYIENIKYLKNKNLFVLGTIFFLFILLCSKFDFESAYKLTNSGGGFFYNFSKLIIQNNLILFLASLLGFLLIISSFYYNYSNIILFITIIFSNPQLTLWQANYSPFIFMIIFLLLKLKYKNNIISNNSIFSLFIYFSVYLLSNIFLKMYYI
tara:strand:+ start:396 stop:1652 length:1257 start_codon:yes stop_codon:yes gene_type:complete